MFPTHRGMAVDVPYYFRRPLIALVLLGASGLAALSSWRLPPAVPGPLSSALGRPAALVGQVAAYPVGRPQGDSFPIDLRWLRASGGAALPAMGRVWVIRQESHPPLTWGDTVSLWGPLAPAGRPGFADASVFVPPGKSALLHRASLLHPLRWAAAFRARFHKVFQTHLPGVRGDLLCGVVLGERPAGLGLVAQDFRRSGTYHLLVASGSNVGFALGVWWILARWVLWWPRRWMLAGAPGVAFLYAFMAGGQAPVLRAAVMASVGAWGALLGRWDRLEQPLFLSMGLLLLWDPSSLSQPGFQMSYAATLAMASIWGNGQSVGPKLEPSPRSRLVRVGQRFGELSLASFAAQLALAPLLLFYFGRFSLVGILSNVVAVPLAGVCLSLGMGLVFLDGLWPGLAGLWAVPTGWASTALMGWARWWAGVPGGEWHRDINVAQGLVLGAGVVAGLTALHYPRFRWKGLALAGVTAGAAFWGFASPRFGDRLEIFWPGGRTSPLRVQTLTGVTLIERSPGAPRNAGERTAGVHRRIVLGPPLADPAWAVDGSSWVEGGTRWHVLRPDGPGVALRLENGSSSALLAFGLSPAQQAHLVARGLPGVDLLSWSSGHGPPTDRFLAAMGPRWMVVRAGRVARSIRSAETALYRPGRGGLRWMADLGGAGFQEK